MLRSAPRPSYSRELERELRKSVRGEVRFDTGSRALYATDASNYRQVPIGVVLPRDVDDVIQAVALARRFGAPILGRGDLRFACKSKCPVNVDMATYKAEFLSHYYRRRIRRQSAYWMGLIHWWARLASHAPRLVNLFGQRQPFASIAKLVSGMSFKRQLPRFAAKTFTSAAVVRHGKHYSGDDVLWPDTFNNHFHPAVLHAAFDSVSRLHTRCKSLCAHCVAAAHFMILDSWGLPRGCSSRF